MKARTLAPQDLVRQAVIEVAQLPENELLIVIEMVDSLKKQRPILMVNLRRKLSLVPKPARQRPVIFHV